MLPAFTPPCPLPFFAEPALRSTVPYSLSSKRPPFALLLAVPVFCRRCGTELENRIPPGDNRLRHVCPNCHYIEYENPKVVVGTVALSRDRQRVLLAKRAIPTIGLWTLPAGFLEIGETAEEGAAREAWEEAGARLQIDPPRLAAVYNILPAKQIQMLFWSVLENEEGVKPGQESLEVRMFEWADIPWDQLAFPTVTWALEYCFENKEIDTAPPQMKTK